MFTLAHLSDPHLAPLPKPRLSELIGKRLTGYLNWQRNRRFIHDPEVLAGVVADIKAANPDHVAVTGDLANISLPGEFVHGSAWLAALGKPDEVTVIPGNHDTYVRAAAHAPEQHWGAYMAGDGHADASKGFPFVRKRGPVALIGVSTAVPTLPLMATGWLGAAQLDRLANMLGWLAFQPDAPFRVVLIHHPPVSKAARHKRMTDSAAFHKVIAKAGAELVIHGHDHEHMLNWLEGPNGRVPVIGVPSASSADGDALQRAGHNFYRIESEQDEWRLMVESRSLGANRRIIPMKNFELKIRKTR